MKNGFIILVTAWTSCAESCASLAQPAPEAARPNIIIIILADDIGYGDLSCYGAKMVRTPNLDRLAREGRRFTDAHSTAATCTPTRRALLTGRYSWRQPEGTHIAPGDEAITIKPGTFTLPGMLKQSGYTTGIVGKWHLGDTTSEFMPASRGFDFAMGSLGNTNEKMAEMTALFDKWTATMCPPRWEDLRWNGETKGPKGPNSKNTKKLDLE